MEGRTLLSDADHFDEQRENALFGISVTFAAISFVLSSMVLLSYFAHRNLRTRSFLLVAQLAWADIGADLSYFIGDAPDGSGTCTFQGFLQQFSQLASFLWATLIAVQLFRKLVRRVPDLAFWQLCLVGYGIPAILALLPLTTESYGQVGGWCWIRASSERDFDVGTMWRFLSFYAVLWVCIILDVVLMLQVRGHVQRLVASAGGHATMSEHSRRMLATVDRLKYYPLILVVCWTPATINRIHNSVQPTDPIFALKLLQVLFRSVQGIANALTYGFNGSVRATWWRTLRTHCPSAFEWAAGMGCVGDEASILRQEAQAETDEDDGTGGALADKVELAEMHEGPGGEMGSEEAILPSEEL